MAIRFFCLHGHYLELKAAPADRERVICPICGCVTDLDTAKCTVSAGSHDATQDVPSSGSQAGASVRSSERLDTPTEYYDETVETDRKAGRSRFVAATLPSDGVSAAEIQHQQVESAGGSIASNESPLKRPSRDAVVVRRAAEQQAEDLSPPELEGFELLGELGRGGMGVVYRAYETEHGRHVALKTLQRMSPVDLQHFKQEFRSLANVAHPNLASLHSLLSDGQTWCFTMELLDGVDALEYVWSGFEATKQRRVKVPPAESEGQRLSEPQRQRLKDMLQQLALGLHALHEAGMLHRDVKPSNVLMTTDGCAKLLDFGLSAEVHSEHGEARRMRIQGTPQYMAPEQAAAEKVSEASDWYAVGVMLYEVLTGQLPIKGKALEILIRKQSWTPPEPRQIEPSTPLELNDLCMSLLARDPAERPAAPEVLRCLGAHELAGTLREIRRSSEREIELVGRQRHLSTLQKSFLQVLEGDTRSVFVHGRSGMGKTVLISRFLDQLRGPGGTIILSGRCFEQESVPFKALDSLIDSLAVYLETLAESEVQKLLPHDYQPLMRLFPVLGQVVAGSGESAPSIEGADQQELRQRALDGLRELLSRLGSQTPLVLYIDDLQWGDEDSAALLADLVRPPHAPRLLLLGSYRSEDVKSSVCLRALFDAYDRGQSSREELPVESLSHDESTELALMLLDRDDADSRRFAERIARESGGWPFFVWELAQHVQDDIGCADGVLELDEVIWSRVCGLPDDTRRLLELFAVAGRPMLAPQAYEAIDRVSQGPGLLAQLRSNNFVRITELEGEAFVETYHDRIRESVVNHLPKQAVREQNLMLALATERSSGIQVADLEAHLRCTPAFEEPTQLLELPRQQRQRVFDLACFFNAAGKTRRAFPFALVAAEQARAQNALEVAEQQYHIALRGADEVDAAIRFRVLEGLGEVLMTQARYDVAEGHFQAARALATDNVTLARVDGKLGFLDFKRGEMASSAKHLERALTELGSRPPQGKASLFPLLLKEIIVQTGHTLLPKWFVGRRRADTAKCRKDRLRIRIYDTLCYPYWFQRGAEATLWAQLRHLNLAERYPPSQELGRAYSFHAVMMTAIPLAKRGIAYADKSYEIHGEEGYMLGQGKARSYQTFALLALGRFRQAVKSGREAVRLLVQAGDVWEANMARLILSPPLYYLGDLRAAMLEAKQAYEIGEATGDTSAMAIGLAFWIMAAPETIPAGAIQAELERPREDPLSAAVVIQARGLELLLCQNQPQQAADVLQQSLDHAKQRGLRNPCIFTGHVWKATALRVVAEREAEGPARRARLQAARKALRAALAISKKYLHCRAHALREGGRMAVLARNERRARQFFDASLRIAEQQNAAFEAAQTLLAQGLAGQEFGWPDANDQVISARAQLAKIQKLDA